MENTYTQYLVFAILGAIVLAGGWLSHLKDKRELEEFYKKYPKYDPRIKKEKRGKKKPKLGHNPNRAV